MGPLTLEVFAQELMRDRLAQAQQAALVAQARSVTNEREGAFGAAARRRVAGGLRWLAIRVDPNLAGAAAQPRLATARPH